ncbi:Elongation factor 1-delta [Saguinus oedipus]|uniref:Elongation factor 1-delta n=1 Tax=Saguinus oedipus TaxID=9490 RepID=A0ABQ9UR01_SAGOE|nr:Elongation factor 1-delta [Saguinus oedipus]
MRKMATNFLVHEKIWFYKFKYDDAESRFYKQMNGAVAGVSHEENGTSVILRDTARARENIQKSLAGSSGPGASSGPRGDHSKLLVWIASLNGEEACVSCPQTQHVSPMRLVEPSTKKPATPAEDEDNDIDLFGNDNEEEDKEAAQLQEKWLQQYTEKKAKKPYAGGQVLHPAGRQALG